METGTFRMHGCDFPEMFARASRREFPSQNPIPESRHCDYFPGCSSKLFSSVCGRMEAGRCRFLMTRTRLRRRLLTAEGFRGGGLPAESRRSSSWRSSMPAECRRSSCRRSLLMRLFILLLLLLLFLFMFLLLLLFL